MSVVVWVAFLGTLKDDGVRFLHLLNFLNKIMLVLRDRGFSGEDSSFMLASSFP